MGVVSRAVPLVSPAPLVGALCRRRFTGILRLGLDGRRYALCFQNGDIVDADQSSSEDTLGRVALAAGLVDLDAVTTSLRQMAQDRTRSQRDILVKMGALGGDALERALRTTLTRRAMRIFALAGATHHVEEVDHGRLEGGPLEPRWVVHRGLRTYYDEQRLDLEVDSLVGKAIRLTADPARISAAFGFAYEELAVVRYLAKKHYWELPDLVDFCPTVPRVVVLAVVHALHAFEQLDVRPHGSVPRYRRLVPEPPVPVSTVRSVAHTLSTARPRGGPAGTLPPLGPPPRSPTASQPLRLPDRPAVLGEDRHASSGAHEVARAMSASEHFRRGEEALRREAFAAAVAEFRTAIDLDSSCAKYHAFLAWSRWCEAGDKNEVASEVQGGLVKAIKLSGHRCVPAFYFRGLMLDARGEHEKAYRSFQIVRSLDERHVEAARRMHLIERCKLLVPKVLIERLRTK